MMFLYKPVQSPFLLLALVLGCLDISQTFSWTSHSIRPRFLPPTEQPTPTRSSLCLSSSPNELISNEFSRTIPPDRIKNRPSNTAGGRRNRDYQLSISATDEECKALARRFDLKHIESLEANVVVRSEHSSSSGVEVEGVVVAGVTQTCVRTNEDFPVQVEFPLYAIVRPVIPLSASFNANEYDNDTEDGLSNSQTTSKQQKREKSTSSSSYRAGSRLDDLDLMEMQRMLQEDIALEDDDTSLMEDESIYPMGGQIDIGELVAQLFWLGLDPYPKKPGTDPIQRTITG